jgi:hypothetical protein
MVMNYIEQLAGRIRSSLEAQATSIPDDADSLLLIYALLARTRGRDTSREDVHDAWATWMTLRGETHQSLVPYGTLPAEVQLEDEPFRRAILAVVEGR